MERQIVNNRDLWKLMQEVIPALYPYYEPVIERAAVEAGFDRRIWSQAEQALSCLAAYRDDAHLSAWRPSGLSPTALEALTLLWRGEADSLETVCEKLPHRGHPPQVYAQALDELREREFIAGPDYALRVTAAGQRFRDEIEDKTNRYFFGPWTSLNEAEKVVLADLLTRLRNGLKTGALS